MNIKFVCFDFDGVLTNNSVTFDANNQIIKSYNVKDGMGIKLLLNNNIQVGVISSYKYNESTMNICKHLNIKYISVGDNDNKITVLNKWLSELNLTLYDTAYMGDDISDIELLSKVGLSGCPNDAIEQCKNMSTFISTKNGGYGCIREFVQYILDNNNNNNNIYDDPIRCVKKEINYVMDNFPYSDVNEYASIILNCKSNIYFTGIGKCETIAIHCSNLLKSIGINSFYLNTMNALHGDIGPINNEDVIFMFSKSGSTNELLLLSNYLKKRTDEIYGIFCNNNPSLKEYCRKYAYIPLNNEMNGPISCIPTNSNVCFMLFCNFLVHNISIKMDISIDQYKLNHPAGHIGKKLLSTINDVILRDYPKIILDHTVPLHDILFKMISYKIGCCIFVDNANNMLGLLTDGDIRRSLYDNSDLKIITDEIINKNYFYLTDTNKRIIDIDVKKYKFIPILDNNKIIGLFDYYSCM